MKLEVWWGDDRSYDQHFLQMIDHQKKVPVIIYQPKKYFAFKVTLFCIELDL